MDGMNMSYDDLYGIMEDMSYGDLMALIEIYAEEKVKCCILDRLVVGEPAGRTRDLVKCYLADIAEHVMLLDETIMDEVKEWREINNYKEEE